MLSLIQHRLKARVCVRAPDDILRCVLRKLLGGQGNRLLNLFFRKKLHPAKLFVSAVYLGKRQTQLTGGSLGVERTAAAQPDIDKRNIAVVCGDELVRSRDAY